MKKLLTLTLALICVMLAKAESEPLHVDAEGFYEVSTAPQLLQAVKSNLSSDGKTSYAKIRLKSDIYLSDFSGGTLCSTFGGTLDGDGHTIWAARPEVTHDGGGHYARGFIFTHAKGATFKNLTYRNQRQGNPDWDNQAIITQDAETCTFDGITFDNVSVWSHHDNAGAVAGYANDCKFSNITVRNSDFTADGDCVGAVVGDAKDCRFTNIEINSCECTADDDCAGGMAGKVYNSKIANIDVKNSYVTVNGCKAGGVVGSAEYTDHSYCVIDDQSCVCSDGNGLHAYAGGVTGYSRFSAWLQCANSALIAGDDNGVGGIVGYEFIDNDEQNEELFYLGDRLINLCLNTGMIIGIKKEKVTGGLYSRYKNKEMSYVTKNFGGKLYDVRVLEPGTGSTSDEGYGGIIGYADGTITVRRCSNLGSLNETGSSGGIMGRTNDKSDIRDCLNDFEGNESKNVCAFLGYYDRPYFIPKDPYVYDCVNNSYNRLYAGTGYVNADGNPTLKHYSGDYNDLITVDDLHSGCLIDRLNWWTYIYWRQDLGNDPTPIPISGDGLIHTRELASEFGTICLPFTIKTDEDVQLYKPQSITEGEAAYFLMLEPAEQLAAGEPGFYCAVNPGATYVFRDAGGDHKFSVQEYDVDGWTMMGTMYDAIKGRDDEATYYSLSRRKFVTSDEVAPYSAYLRAPSSHSDKPVYLVCTSSPYDVNFDDEVNVGDVISLIKQGEDFTPFTSGDNRANQVKLSDVILGK